MRFLFFLMSALYSFIFYLFYIYSSSENIVNKNIYDYIIALNSTWKINNDENFYSIFWNLTFEIIVFLLIGIFLFFYFSSYDKNKKILINFNNENILKKYFTKDNFIKFLKKFSYYIWFIFFYLSLYLIFEWYSLVTFSQLILLINIIIYIYFFLSKYSKISGDFLKINSILFSVGYLIAYFYIIIFNKEIFTYIDFINTFLILLTFPTILYFDKEVNKRNNFDNGLIIYFSIYIFGVFLFYLYKYLFNKDLIYRISIIATFFWIIWFQYLSKLKFLKNDKLVIKYIGIIFTYIGIIFWLIYLSINYKPNNFHNYFIMFVLLLQSYYNFFIHKKYINFISFSLWIFLIIYLFFYSILFFDLLKFITIKFSIILLSISFLFVIFTYLFKIKSIIENYIIHSYAHIINIIWVIMFFKSEFIKNEFDFLNIWILLFIESIYFFLSYNKLNTNKK